MAKKILSDQDELVDVPHASNDVPWKRAGTPMFEGSEEGYKWLNDVCNKGGDQDRVFTDDELIYMGAKWNGEVPMGALRERAIVHLWDYENNSPHGNKLLHALLQSVMGKTVLTQRDLFLCELGAVTALQWTQTNCGRGFMENVVKFAQREQKRLSPMVKKHMKLLVAVGDLHDQDGKIMGRKHDKKGKAAKGAGGAGTAVGGKRAAAVGA